MREHVVGELDRDDRDAEDLLDLGARIFGIAEDLEDLAGELAARRIGIARDLDDDGVAGFDGCDMGAACGMGASGLGSAGPYYNRAPAGSLAGPPARVYRGLRNDRPLREPSRRPSVTLRPAPLLLGLALVLPAAALSAQVRAGDARTVRIVQTNAAGDEIHLIDPATNRGCPGVFLENSSAASRASRAASTLISRTCSSMRNSSTPASDAPNVFVETISAPASKYSR